MSISINEPNLTLASDQPKLDFMIRKAELSDLAQLARVTQSSWQQAFNTFLPSGILQRGTIEFFEALWCDILTNKEDEQALVIELSCANMATEIVACGAYGRYRQSHNPQINNIKLSDSGELYRGYVTPSYQGFGLGRQLLMARLDALTKLNFQYAYAWIYQDNHNARDFFSYLGAERVGQGEGTTMQSHNFNEVCYRFALNA